jgi:hypothetical protein
MVLESADRRISIQNLALEAPEKSRDIADIVTPEIWQQVIGSLENRDEKLPWKEYLNTIYPVALLNPSKLERLDYWAPEDWLATMVSTLEDQRDMQAFVSVGMLKQIEPFFSSRVGIKRGMWTQWQLEIEHGSKNWETKLNWLFGAHLVDPLRVRELLDRHPKVLPELQQLISKLISEAKGNGDWSELVENWAKFRTLFPKQFNFEQLTPYLGDIETSFVRGADIIRQHIEQQTHQQAIETESVNLLSAIAYYKILTAAQIKVTNGYIETSGSLAQNSVKIKDKEPTLPEQRNF